MPPTVHDLLREVALEKGLREATVVSYERLLRRLDLLDMDPAQVTREEALRRLWAIDSTNTRRAAVIALRSVLGLDIRIPKGIPRRYDLPSEDTLRIALMTSPHEVRGLLMMYGGLRIGEACAITGEDLTDDQLRVDKQLLVIQHTGAPTTVRIGPVKTAEENVTLPHWLLPRVSALRDTPRSDSVRESLRRAGWKVGINLNPHMLRHWCATTLLARGTPLIAVSRHLRHTDVATTMRTYAQADQAGTIHDAWG